MNFFMVYDIDIHQLNIRKKFNLKFLDTISLKKMHLFNNECIIISFFKKEPPTISKRRKFCKWALHYFFNFLLFGNVLLIINMRPYGH